jgi:TPR repeat protein
MYFYGRGVPQDYAETVMWFRLAADKGNASGQFLLGTMYDNGRGVRQDLAEAVKWYHLAAEQGHERAQYILGLMYGSGRGVPLDHVRAHMWFNLAAARGNQDAAMGRERAAQHMIPAQIAEAQKLAREWKPATKLAR